MSKKSQKAYVDFIGQAAASLGHDEYWCIDHDNGSIKDTASKDIGYPVILFCSAMNCDWDEAQESGFRLGKIKLAKLALDAERFEP